MEGIRFRDAIEDSEWTGRTSGIEIGGRSRCLSGATVTLRMECVWEGVALWDWERRMECLRGTADFERPTKKENLRVDLRDEGGGVS